METLSSCLPLSGQAPPQVMQIDDVQALSGAEFLQMLTALTAGTTPGQAEASLLPALPAELKPEIKEEPDAPADAALALQWLPLTQFIENGMAQKPAPAATTAEDAIDAALLQSATTAAASTAVASSVPGKKTPATTDPAAVAVPDPLLSGDSGDGMTQDAAAFAATLADAELTGTTGFTDKPAAGLTGSNALSASASAINALHSGAERTQSPAPMSAEQTAAQAHIRAPVHSSRWAQEIGQRITMMAAAGQQNGTLTLTPENMGPLEVRINVSQDTANVWFGAQQADTRAALTDALPRLREMFAANGLSLGEANVSQETPRQDSEAAKAFRGEAAGRDDPGPRDLPRHAQRVSLGMIDTYA